MDHEITVRLPAIAPTLRAKIKAYKKKVYEMEDFLKKRPYEWGRFQSEFNQEINGIFRDLMIFEREQLARGNEDKVYKLKRIFVEWFRRDFVRGEYLIWSLKKPYGYAGDFKIMDDIYQNSPKSIGFERLYDNYFQMSTICNAVRNRKEDFKRLITNLVDKRHNLPTKIMDLASGPCRDVFEIISNHSLVKKDVIFHCYDSDIRAIEYARRLLGFDSRVHFFHENAVRLALKRNIEAVVKDRYDLIYSVGLFDYLDTRVSIRLIKNLRQLLNEGGILAISDVRDKFSNPSLYFMEWVADWNLIYRDDDNFRSLFLGAGFSKEELTYDYEQQGLMQYIIAVRQDS